MARSLSGIIFTRATSALMSAPMKQMAEKRIFVGFRPPRKIDSKDKPVRTKKPSIGGITEIFDTCRLSVIKLCPPIG
jgi:hypothetical protein